MLLLKYKYGDNQAFECTSEKYPAHFGHLLFIIEKRRGLLLPAAFHRNFKYEHYFCCYLYTGKLYVRLKFLQGKLFKTQLSLKADLPQQRLGVAHKAIYSAFCILHSMHTDGRPVLNSFWNFYLILLQRKGVQRALGIEWVEPPSM